MAIRRPRLELLTRAAGQSARRFPWALGSALLAAVASIALIERGEESPALVKLLLCGQLGIPLLAALSILAEQRQRIGLPTVAARLLPLLGIGTLAAYYVSLSTPFPVVTWFRFAQLNVAAHLLVAVAAFPTGGLTSAFWQTNCRLLVRLLVGVLFTGVLLAGLAVALKALDALFGIPVGDRIYSQLWVLLAFVFNTWYWLGGVPRHVAELESEETYPAAVRVFGQWILAPLVAVYLILLTAYLVKVLITAQWPSGWIGWLVSSVGAAGLFSLLLLFPVARQGGNPWLRRYAFIFHLLVLPAVAMLLLALDQRLGQYGLTEKRYYLGVLAVWLGAISVVALIRRRILVQAIPVSLLLVALTTAFGPWGAFAVSRGSQLDRLDGLLERNALLADGVLAPATGEISLEDRREISAGVRYLVETHGVAALTSRLPRTLASRLDSLAAERTDRLAPSHEPTDIIIRHLGFEPVSRWETAEREFYQFQRRDGAPPFSLDGYERGLRLQLYPAQDQTFELAGRSYRIDLEDAGLEIVRAAPDSLGLRFDLEDLVTRLTDRARTLAPGDMPADLMGLSAQNEGLACRLEIRRLDAHRGAEGLEVHHLGGVLLLRIPSR